MLTVVDGSVARTVAVVSAAVVGLASIVVGPVDTTAVVAHAMGMDIPEEFEGTVPEDLYAPEWLEKHPVRIAGHTDAGAAPKTHAKDEDISDDQREEMLAQLRLLGYLED